MRHEDKHSQHAAIVRYSRGWPGFHTFEDFENAPPITFAIRGFLQNDGAMLIGGLPGHGKTLILLSVVKALLAGKGAKLWGTFDVAENAERLLYLTPEVSLSPFKHRLKLFDLYRYVENGRLLVRTLSFGSTTNLGDKDIMSAAKGTHVFLDSIIRFVEGDESKASDNQRGLAKRIFDLLNAGARSVVGAAHSPKYSRTPFMTLENTLRGSGDIGAVISTAFGVKQLDSRQNIIQVEAIKARDFEPSPAFQIIGRPYITNEHDFRMHKQPGECRSLTEEKNRGGAPQERRDQRARNKDALRRLLENDPTAKAKDLAKRLQKETGAEYEEGTIRRLRAEIQKEAA